MESGTTRASPRRKIQVFYSNLSFTHLVFNDSRKQSVKNRQQGRPRRRGLTPTDATEIRGSRCVWGPAEGPARVVPARETGLLGAPSSPFSLAPGGGIWAGTTHPQQPWVTTGRQQCSPLVPLLPVSRSARGAGESGHEEETPVWP